MALLAARKTPRENWFMLGGSLMWVFLVASWGHFTDWGETIHPLEYMLPRFILPLMGAWLGFSLWKWAKGHSENHENSYNFHPVRVSRVL